MSRSSARRIVSACALSATMAAFAVPGTASAKVVKGKVGEQCSSEEAVNGRGSSLQKLAQVETWIPAFENAANTNKAACSGTQGGKKTPKLTYQPEGSGAGLKAFGAEGEPKLSGKEVQFAGTDEPPNEKQKSEIESHEKTPAKEALLSIPVIQAAVTNIVHLPEHCTATSTAAPGRLALNNVTLVKIWLGEITKWSELTEDGNKLSGEGCNPEEEIKHVVRLDQSGTTHIYKKYLGLISTEQVPFENVAKESVGNKDFSETSEGTENQSWPVADKVLRPAKKGGGEVAAEVFATPSSIGYVNLAEARVDGFSPAAKSGGPGTATFWTELQNDGVITTGKITYADPATNLDVGVDGNSNCAAEAYTNGAGKKFPPKSTKLLWNSVTTATKEKHYPACGLSYDLALTKYQDFTEAPTEGQVTTVSDYIGFILNSETGGGQVEIQNKDYEALPSKLLKIAREGQEEVGN